MPTETQNPNYYVRTLIAVLAGLLGLMIGYRFLCISPRGELSAGVLTLIFLVVVLVLAESFDNFSIGRLFSISRKVSEKEKEVEKLTRDKDQLINQLISLSVSQSQNQNHTNVYGDYNASPIVGQATGQEIEQKKEDELATHDAAATHVSVTPQPVAPGVAQRSAASEISGTEYTQRENTTSGLRLNLAKVEDIAFNKYFGDRGIRTLDIRREVKLLENEILFDPIGNFPTIFDAYLQDQSGETFVEFKLSRISPIYKDRLYVMLSKILHYRTSKRITAHLDLILINVPGEKERFSYLPRLLKDFSPAIESGLLRIHNVDLTDAEAASCREPW